jgi:hypothetical protein
VSTTADVAEMTLFNIYIAIMTLNIARKLDETCKG